MCYYKHLISLLLNSQGCRPENNIMKTPCFNRSTIPLYIDGNKIGFGFFVSFSHGLDSQSSLLTRYSLLTHALLTPYSLITHSFLTPCLLLAPSLAYSLLTPYSLLTHFVITPCLLLP